MGVAVANVEAGQLHNECMEGFDGFSLRFLSLTVFFLLMGIILYMSFMQSFQVC